MRQRFLLVAASVSAQLSARNIHVPKGTKADKYAGTLNLTADGEALPIPLEVEVLNAILPDSAVMNAAILDSCRMIPPVQEARYIVNSVLGEAGTPEEMGKKTW